MTIGEDAISRGSGWVGTGSSTPSRSEAAPSPSPVSPSMSSPLSSASSSSSSSSSSPSSSSLPLSCELPDSVRVDRPEETFGPVKFDSDSQDGLLRLLDTFAGSTCQEDIRMVLMTTHMARYFCLSSEQAQDLNSPSRNGNWHHYGFAFALARQHVRVAHPTRFPSRQRRVER